MQIHTLYAILLIYHSNNRSTEHITLSFFSSPVILQDFTYCPSSHRSFSNWPFFAKASFGYSKKYFSHQWFLLEHLYYHMRQEQPSLGYRVQSHRVYIHYHFPHSDSIYLLLCLYQLFGLCLYQLYAQPHETAQQVFLIVLLGEG